MKRRVTALVVTLLVLFLLIFSSYQLGARATDFQFFQLESKLIYIILNSLALGALVMFVLVSYLPPALPAGLMKRSTESEPELLRQAETVFQLGDLDKADALLKQADPEHSDFWYAKKIAGDIAYQRGDLRGAEESYQESLKFASGSDRALAMLALADLFDEQGVQERAISLYREITTLFPESREAVVRLRDYAMKDQEWVEALSWQEYMEEHFTKFAQTEQETQIRIGVRYELAQLEFQRGAYKTAQALLKYILRITDSFVPAYLLLGEVQLKLEHSSSALKIWEAGFAATESPIFLERIAECFLAQGAPEAAIEHIRSVIRNKPDNPALQFCLADLYLKMEMLAEAQTVLENIIRKNPDWLLSRSTAAELYLKTGQIQKAAHTLGRLFATGALPSLLQWQCYNCNTNYYTYHALCLECMAWNSIDLNQQKAGNIGTSYREPTALSD